MKKTEKNMQQIFKSKHNDKTTILTTPDNTKEQQAPEKDNAGKQELPESINFSEFGGSGVFYIRNDKFRLDGMDIAEMTTNNSVEYQKEMAAELVKRYNEYDQLKASNEVLREALQDIRNMETSGTRFDVLKIVNEALTKAGE